MSDYDRLKLLSGEEAARLPASLYVDAAEVQGRVQEVVDEILDRGSLTMAEIRDRLWRLIKELEP